MKLRCIKTTRMPGSTRAGINAAAGGGEGRAVDLRLTSTAPRCSWPDKDERAHTAAAAERRLKPMCGSRPRAIGMWADEGGLGLSSLPRSLLCSSADDSAASGRETKQWLCASSPLEGPTSVIRSARWPARQSGEGAAARLSN